jgi:hypothetical protein
MYACYVLIPILFMFLPFSYPLFVIGLTAITVLVILVISMISVYLVILVILVISIVMWWLTSQSHVNVVL